MSSSPSPLQRKGPQSGIPQITGHRDKLHEEGRYGTLRALMCGVGDGEDALRKGQELGPKGCGAKNRPLRRQNPPGSKADKESTGVGAIAAAGRGTGGVRPGGGQGRTGSSFQAASSSSLLRFALLPAGSLQSPTPSSGSPAILG